MSSPTTASPTTTTHDRPDTPATPPRGKPIPTLVTELWNLVVAYMKQETVEPLKGIGRYIGFGAAGSIAIALGVTLLILSLLRGLQRTFGTRGRGLSQLMTGSLSWLPYLITLVFAVTIVDSARRAIKKKKNNGKRS